MSKVILYLVVIQVYIFSFAFGQSNGKYINVGDTTINLADVDINKGLTVSNREYLGSSDDHLSRYIADTKIFTCNDYSHFSIVHDTLKFHGRGISPSSGLKYFDDKNELLFEKYYTNLSLYNCYISSNGETVITYVCNEDNQRITLYDKRGIKIKEYDNQNERFYTGTRHHYFMICNHSNYDGPNTFDLIDKYGNTSEVTFREGFFRGLKFSPQENYYLVLLGKDQLLFDINNNLIWEIKNFVNGINITPDEKRYLVRNFNNESIEVKDLFSHELIYSIDNVFYEDQELPIYMWNIFNENFYTIGKNEEVYIYNIYNLDGDLLQTATIDKKENFRRYEVLKQADKFVISEKNSQ